MRTGRDLLHTHFRIGPDGTRRDHSEWAQVITSAPVTRALLLQVGSWARQIAPQGTALALSRAPAQRGTEEARRQLNAACQWLWVLHSVVQAAHRQDPVSAEDARLLEAIPVNEPPARHAPDGTETIQDLSQGTVGSAERVRHIARLLAPQADWSPGLTADSLRQSAGCGTVISHHCEILLRSLATRAARHRDATLSTGLLASADACGHARQAWLQAARGWTQVTTETRGVISPAAAEAADLALWTGRLAYADPRWTLKRGPSQETRPPRALTAAPGDLQRVVAAVHHACHALTQIAAADQDQIRTVASAGRLLVTTRSLPDTFDIPHPFARAPSDRVEQVLDGYRDAGTASTCATAAVGEVAAAVRAPSQVLTAARAAIQAGGGLAANDRQPVAVAEPERGTALDPKPRRSRRAHPARPRHHQPAGAPARRRDRQGRRADHPRKRPRSKPPALRSRRPEQIHRNRRTDQPHARIRQPPRRHHAPPASTLQSSRSRSRSRAVNDRLHAPPLLTPPPYAEPPAWESEARGSCRYGGSSYRAGQVTWKYVPWDETSWWTGATDPQRAVALLKSRGYDLLKHDPVPIDRSAYGPIPGSSSPDSRRGIHARRCSTILRACQPASPARTGLAPGFLVLADQRRGRPLMVRRADCLTRPHMFRQLNGAQSCFWIIQQCRKLRP
jgi:hypothetical protein